MSQSTKTNDRYLVNCENTSQQLRQTDTCQEVSFAEKHFSHLFPQNENKAPSTASKCKLHLFQCDDYELDCMFVLRRYK